MSSLQAQCNERSCPLQPHFTGEGGEEGVRVTSVRNKGVCVGECLCVCLCVSMCVYVSVLRCICVPVSVWGCICVSVCVTEGKEGAG